MIGVGFIGVGGMGSYQAKSFAQVKGCKVVAGSDLSAEARSNFAKTYPGAGVYEDYKQLLNDPKVDAVVAAVPTLFHKDIAIDAMKSGRPVLMEKPLARTVADCRKMIEVSKKTGKLLMVAHCRRYDADWGTFARIIRDDKLGRPVIWRHLAASQGPGRWFMDHKLGGGPLMDGAIHNQDFANMLFGEPVEVIARGIKLTDSTCVDTASAIIQYKGGDQLVLSWCWGRGGGAHAIDALGPKGALQWGAGGLPVDPKDNGKFGYYCYTPAGGKPKLFKFKRQDMYVNQARHFLDCINGKAQCLTPPEEAIKGVAVAEAILQATTRSGPVKIAW